MLFIRNEKIEKIKNKQYKPSGNGLSVWEVMGNRVQSVFPMKEPCVNDTASVPGG